jgi:hypothetical protein
VVAELKEHSSCNKHHGGNDQGKNAVKIPEEEQKSS